MAVVAVAVCGDKALDKAFRRLSLVEQRKAMREASRTVLKDLQNAVRNAAPVRTGALARAVHPVRALKRRRGRIGHQLEQPSRAKLKIPPNATGYYPAHVEVGTSKMEARPYLRPVFDANRERMTRDYIDKMWAVIRREWAK